MGGNGSVTFPSITRTVYQSKARIKVFSKEEEAEGTVGEREGKGIRPFPSSKPALSSMATTDHWWELGT